MAGLLACGDGLFEGILVEDGVICQRDEHVARLHRSARYLAIAVAPSPAALRAAIVEVARRNDLRVASGP